MTDFAQRPDKAHEDDDSAILPKPPGWLAVLASPQGVQGANALISLYSAAYRRWPWFTAFATGAAVAMIVMRGGQSASEPSEP